MGEDLRITSVTDCFNACARKVVDLEEMENELEDLYEQKLSRVEKAYLMHHADSPIGFVQGVHQYAKRRANEECSNLTGAVYNLRLRDAVRQLRKLEYSAGNMKKKSRMYICPDEKEIILFDGATLSDIYCDAMKQTTFPDLTHKCWKLAAEAFDYCEDVPRDMIASISGVVEL